MESNYKKILFNLIGSLTIADHMGDVSNDVYEALKQAGIDLECEWDDLGGELHKMGYTTLWGTSLED